MKSMDEEANSNNSNSSPETEASQEREDPVIRALQATLEDLNRSIERMEAIMAQLETGGTDWQESARLISEANELAMSSSQNLDRLVQDVAYGSGGHAWSEDEEGGRQQSLDLH